MFSSEYCEIFKNTYFDKHLRTAASEISRFSKLATLLINPYVPDVHQKGHTYLNKIAALFKYMRGFSGHQVLKG